MQFRQLLPKLLPTTAKLALLTAIMSSALAKPSPNGAEHAAARPRRVQPVGILTDRLSAKDLRKWQAIERLALASDWRGQPRHPTLRGLYEWAATSGHAVYIEFPPPQRAATCTAGSFTIERLDPLGKRHVGVIRLYLNNIDAAYVGKKVARAGGFVPFHGLGKVARYAEVLGHELAHTAHILSDPERAALVREVVEETNELLLDHSRRAPRASIGLEMQRRLTLRDMLLEELEKQAEAMEEAVWRELVSGQRER
jgi:hypothetical protein